MNWPWLGLLSTELKCTIVAASVPQVFCSTLVGRALRILQGFHASFHFNTETKRTEFFQRLYLSLHLDLDQLRWIPGIRRNSVRCIRQRVMWCLCSQEPSRLGFHQRGPREPQSFQLFPTTKRCMGCTWCNCENGNWMAIYAIDPTSPKIGFLSHARFWSIVLTADDLFCSLGTGAWSLHFPAASSNRSSRVAVWAAAHVLVFLGALLKQLDWIFISLYFVSVFHDTYGILWDPITSSGPSCHYIHIVT